MLVARSIEQGRDDDVALEGAGGCGDRSGERQTDRRYACELNHGYLLRILRAAPDWTQRPSPIRFAGMFQHAVDL